MSGAECGHADAQLAKVPVSLGGMVVVVSCAGCGVHIGLKELLRIYGAAKSYIQSEQDYYDRSKEFANQFPGRMGYKEREEFNKGRSAVMAPIIEMKRQAFASLRRLIFDWPTRDQQLKDRREAKYRSSK